MSIGKRQGRCTAFAAAEVSAGLRWRVCGGSNVGFWKTVWRALLMLQVLERKGEGNNTLTQHKKWPLVSIVGANWNLEFQAVT